MSHLNVAKCTIHFKVLFFLIYSSETRCNHAKVTEPYVISLTSLGMPHDVEKIGKLKNVFKDLTHKELTTDLYLVVRLIRRGVLKRENETNTSQTVIRGKDVPLIRSFVNL